nr:chalcone isomerase family protein [Variovorax sp. PBL-E5]
MNMEVTSLAERQGSDKRLHFAGSFRQQGQPGGTMNQAAWRSGLALAVLAAASACATAVPIEAGGVPFDEAIRLGGRPLLLNGAGVRNKAVFKVYAAGLYLSTRATTTEEVLSMAGPKRLAITMLHDVDADVLGRLFTHGVEDNSPRSRMSQLVPGLLRMGQIFSDQKELKAGDSLVIDWIPGAGTILTIKGATQGAPIREPEFFDALLRIWLGPVPADWKLKDALLGK